MRQTASVLLKSRTSTVGFNVNEENLILKREFIPKVISKNLKLSSILAESAAEYNSSCIIILDSLNSDLIL